MIRESMYEYLAKRCAERLSTRSHFYTTPEPFELMSDEDYVSMLRVKLFRVQQGVDVEKRCDDLEDLIAYAVVLLDRLRQEAKAKEEGKDET